MQLIAICLAVSGGCFVAMHSGDKHDGGAVNLGINNDYFCLPVWTICRD